MSGMIRKSGPRPPPSHRTPRLPSPFVLTRAQVTYVMTRAGQSFPSRSLCAWVRGGGEGHIRSGDLDDLPLQADQIGGGLRHLCRCQLQCRCITLRRHSAASPIEISSEVSARLKRWRNDSKETQGAPTPLRRDHF